MLFVYLTSIIFVIALLGIVFNFQNVLIILMGVELLLLSTNLNFIFFSIYLDDLYGQLFSLFILTIAASESAIGLAIIISHYRSRGNILLSNITLLKG
jgi:NADH-quinone oxidoreductase subunit K